MKRQELAVGMEVFVSLGRYLTYRATVVDTRRWAVDSGWSGWANKAREYMLEDGSRADLTNRIARPEERNVQGVVVRLDRRFYADDDDDLPLLDSYRQVRVVALRQIEGEYAEVASRLREAAAVERAARAAAQNQRQEHEDNKRRVQARLDAVAPLLYLTDEERDKQETMHIKVSVLNALLDLVEQEVS